MNIIEYAILQVWYNIRIKFRLFIISAIEWRILYLLQASAGAEEVKTQWKKQREDKKWYAQWSALLARAKKEGVVEAQHCEEHHIYVYVCIEPNLI